MELRKNPQMKRALDNFKAVLDLRINHSDINDAQIKRIIGVIDRAALEIRRTGLSGLRVLFADAEHVNQLF